MEDSPSLVVIERDAEQLHVAGSLTPGDAVTIVRDTVRHLIGFECFCEVGVVLNVLESNAQRGLFVLQLPVEHSFELVFQVIVVPPGISAMVVTVIEGGKFVFDFSLERVFQTIFFQRYS